MAPQAQVKGGSNDGSVAGGHHEGSTDNNNDGVVEGETAPLPSVAANGNGKQRAAVDPKDKYWTTIDYGEAAEAVEDGGKGKRRPLLLRTYRVKGILLHPYRLLTLLRLIAIIQFFIWRVKNPCADGMWVWWISIVGDFLFGVTWLLIQVAKLNPIKHVPDISLLKQQFDLPDGSSNLPRLDVFINTVDPINEPMIYTMNSILSILAVDYPVDRSATYLSDDGGSIIHYEGLLETANFARIWVPFCRKHCIEPRAPERYFAVKGRPYTGDAPDEFADDHSHMSREYDEFKARLDALFTEIPERSDAYNNNAEAKQGAKATWMADGTEWPGTWLDPAENHKKGQHAGIFKVMLSHPGDEPRFGAPASAENPLDFSGVDVRLPMLVYISREKSPSYDHQNKAGAMNVLLRVSALVTNAPFIINFDGDHYVNNSQAFRAAMCFMLDRHDGDNTAFVQFPQRFDGVDPTDRYYNHNRVFFDATMVCLNGIQGPTYVGTGCMFRRIAVYGIDPPRWRTKIVDNPSKFGNSTPFINSIPLAANQEWSMTSPPAHEESALMEELNNVMKCAYDEGTEFGKEVGWVYNIVTEDVVTGMKMHRKGWRSMYCRIEPDAFCGTAPINLTERLYQTLRWSDGSLEIFFSHCPLFAAGRRLNIMQRIAYTILTGEPILSVFLAFYLLFPVIWIFRGEFYMQKPFPTYVLYLVIIIAMRELIAMVEIKWAGLTFLDWIRNEQFHMIGATAVYPLATLHTVLKLVFRGNGVSFKLTPKQATSTVNEEKFAELYTVRWAPLLIPTIVVIAVNVGAIGAAIGKAIVGGWSVLQMADASLELVFSTGILLLIYPFALGIMGRWSKRPYILFILFMIAFLVVAAVVVAIHAARTASVQFHSRIQEVLVSLQAGVFSLMWS